MADKNLEVKEDVIKKHIKVRNLLSSVALVMGHYTLLDRLNNAVSIDAVQKTIYEVSRIALALLNKENENPPFIKVTVKEEAKPYIVVRKDEKSRYEFYGTLPSSSDIDEFLTDSMKDVRIARIIGASAMGHIVSIVGGEKKGGSSIILGGGMG